MADATPSVVLSEIRPDSVTVSVQWTSEDADPTGFKYELVGGGEVRTGTLTTSEAFLIENLDESTKYYIRAAALIEGVYGLWSQSIPFTTPSRASLRLFWTKPEKRYFEAGLDRGVLYRRGGAPAVAWDGLISVEEAGGEGAVAYYIDGRPFLFFPKPKEYQATLSAYMFPEEFSEVMGMGEVADGMYLDSQPSQNFDLSYRTMVGNSAGGVENNYKIHLVYNASVTPSSSTYETLSDSINPTTFSWEIQAVPVKVEGFRPTAHIVIDTRKMDQKKINAIEDLLYGTGPGTAYMPPPQLVFDILNYGDTIVVTDNGDGTFEVEGSYENVYLLDDGQFRVDNIDGTNNGDGTFTISTTEG